jgi:hypothetical protein
VPGTAETGAGCGEVLRQGERTKGEEIMLSERMNIGIIKVGLAFKMLSIQLEEMSRLTLREVYFLNKAKRVLHRFDVHKRKLRKKHEGRRKK